MMTDGTLPTYRFGGRNGQTGDDPSFFEGASDLEGGSQKGHLQRGGMHTC